MKPLFLKPFPFAGNLLISLTVLCFILISCGGGDDDEVSPTTNNNNNNSNKNPSQVVTKTVEDVLSNTYKTVVIGDQEWMAENLTTTRYNDGPDIANITDNTSWTSQTGGAYAWYNNDFDEYGSVYGALYNWHAVNTGKLCPAGWHVPTDEEWTELTDFLGGAEIAGDKLKELGGVAWGNPFSGATNETGFTALPGGFRLHTTGGFGGLETTGYWWSSTAASQNSGHMRYMDYVSKNVYADGANKGAGFCVRCVKD